MRQGEGSSDEIERLNYIADLLVELDYMAARSGHSELSLLIGVAALAAFERETDLTSSVRKER